uniref:Axonemal dynein light intermediate polypeptide 1 n=1 Tax=Spumella elongata TaxID=89044 RepID=A0A7S3MAQ7_9STRA|mmetsp:Transcript_153543/g.492092  ORF Transcript_153543/g.492092 Transcript_153543/m.492092 type:complete len:233 (+) Transcript_153543:96-794(+)|eukprot:CAMPEP_0177212482 /NCGR_PEP_ID=MMETSP0367-20130122/32660_1 /TAXON_ID=447022 ORGANISM="Scrippsiella hangoei-like, Strain SHHI-4" /NCGR_SAMPLE_ID=MMETSP0367 /ASSEMBLY_ACC=CAM_ASM_000362 /LENGTH=232 /DNA_ID=CAMNT_0018661759 /DNA_START=246 /DNA_END=944 /DNA_ORIENTATION=+
MQASLVKYNTPILISTTTGGKGKKEKKAKDVQPAMTQTEDILNSILPPREWTQDDQLWVQYVSSTPATRADVINLQEDLDKWLQQRQARETGICPIREELYSQCFDELIRQVTIICAERGLLLLRVRDEIKMTICAYQSLYESSIAFGMRKALQAEQRRNQHSKRMKDLIVANRKLKEEVEELDTKIAQIEKHEAERREQEERKHKEEVENLKKVNAQRKEQLETLLQAPKK